MMIGFNTFLAAPPFASINRKYLASMFHYPWIQLGMLHFQEWSSDDRKKIWCKILAMNNILPWNCACLKIKSMCKSHRTRSRQNFVSNVEKLTFSMVQNRVFLARCLFFLFIVVWPSACNRHFDFFHFKILKHCYHVWNVAQLATNLYALGPPDTLPIHPRRGLDLGQNCNWSVPVQIPF